MTVCLPNGVAKPTLTQSGNSEPPTAEACGHLGINQDVTPRALDREECLKIASSWEHLRICRICRICRRVGCCNSAPNRHATKHFHTTKYPIIEGYDSPEGWGWCHVDEIMFELSGRMTPDNGPIPRYA